LLGAFADSRSVTVSVELLPGDTMLLYTDGVTDVRPPHDLSDDALCHIVEAARQFGFPDWYLARLESFRR